MSTLSNSVHVTCKLGRGIDVAGRATAYVCTASACIGGIICGIFSRPWLACDHPALHFAIGRKEGRKEERSEDDGCFVLHTLTQIKSD